MHRHHPPALLGERRRAREQRRRVPVVAHSELHQIERALAANGPSGALTTRAQSLQPVKDDEIAARDRLLNDLATAAAVGAEMERQNREALLALTTAAPVPAGG